MDFVIIISVNGQWERYPFKGFNKDDIPNLVQIFCASVLKCSMEECMFFSGTHNLDSGELFVPPFMRGQLPKLPEKEELVHTEILEILIIHRKPDEKINAELLQMKTSAQIYNVMVEHQDSDDYLRAVMDKVKKIDFEFDEKIGLLMVEVINQNRLDVITALLDSGRINPNLSIIVNEHPRNVMSLSQIAIKHYRPAILLEILLRGGDALAAFHYVREGVSNKIQLQRFKMVFIKAGVDHELCERFLSSNQYGALDPERARAMAKHAKDEHEAYIATHSFGVNSLLTSLLISKIGVKELTKIVLSYAADNLIAWGRELNHVSIAPMAQLSSDLRAVPSIRSFGPARALLSPLYLKDAKQAPVNLITAENEFESMLTQFGAIVDCYLDPKGKLRIARKKLHETASPFTSAVATNPSEAKIQKSMWAKVFTGGEFHPVQLLGEIFPAKKTEFSLVHHAKTSSVQLDLGDMELATASTLALQLQAAFYSEHYPKDHSPRITIEAAKNGAKTYLLFKNLSKESLRPLAMQPVEAAQTMERVYQEVVKSPKASPSQQKQ